MIIMEKKSEKTDENQKVPDTNQSQEKAYEKWKDKDKNNMGNDVTSEIKIADAGGQLEGGDNKQWHMDQGNFNKEEKDFFENSNEK
jgi:hypothetical protein